MDAAVVGSYKVPTEDNSRPQRDHLLHSRNVAIMKGRLMYEIIIIIIIIIINKAKHTATIFNDKTL